MRDEGKYDCAKCGHSEKLHKAWKACTHKCEYIPNVERDSPDLAILKEKTDSAIGEVGVKRLEKTPRIIKCSCKEYIAKRILEPIEKPKTSTLEKMIQNDSNLVNQLLVLCGNLYDKVSSPPTKGTHKGDVNEINTNNAELVNNIKSRILLLSMRIGERLWYPKGR